MGPNFSFVIAVNMPLLEERGKTFEYQQTQSDHVFAAKGLYSAQHDEEIVSWIWDFSYIYSADALSLDDNRLREEDVYFQNKWLPDVCLYYLLTSNTDGRLSVAN